MAAHSNISSLRRWDEGQHEIALLFDSVLFKGLSRIPLRQWVEANRIVSGQSPRPGLWSTWWMPPSAALMDAYDDPDVREISIMATPQTIKTEFLLNIIYYTILHDPTSILFALPNEDIGKEIVTDRIEGGAEGMPELRRLLSKRVGIDGRVSPQSILHKVMPGGAVLKVVSGSSRTGLDSRTVKILLADEIDKMESPDFEDRMLVRSTRFPDYKFITTSSPSEERTSLIYRRWIDGSRGRWAGRCQKCGELDVLIWENVQFDRDKEEGGLPVPETAVYKCGRCHAAWTEQERVMAIDGGAYVHENDSNRTHRSFTLNRIGDKHVPLERMVRRFRNALLTNREIGDPVKLIRFYNDEVARPWKHDYKAISAPELMRRLTRPELHQNTPYLHEDAVVIVASVDVQDTWSEIDIGAWGWHPKYNQPRRWGLYHSKVVGPPCFETWNGILSLAAQYWEGPEARQKFKGASLMMIDTGFMSEEVKAFVSRCQVQGFSVFGVKGHGRIGATNDLIVPKTGVVAEFGELKPVEMAVNNIKDWIHETLWHDHNREPEDRLLNWYEGFGYDTAYFNGLVSEIQEKARERGRPVLRWVPKYEGIRNEALDLMVMSVAGMQFHAFQSVVGEVPALAYHWQRFYKDLHLHIASFRKPNLADMGDNVIPLRPPNTPPDLHPVS